MLTIRVFKLMDKITVSVGYEAHGKPAGGGRALVGDIAYQINDERTCDEVWELLELIEPALDLGYRRASEAGGYSLLI